MLFFLVLLAGLVETVQVGHWELWTTVTNFIGHV